METPILSGLSGTGRVGFTQREKQTQQEISFGLSQYKILLENINITLITEMTANLKYQK